jgi:hypothetical protein
MSWYKKHFKKANQDFLWHGTTQKIDGDLEPRQAHDLGGSPTSNMNAVYATPNKEFAIMLGLAENGSDTFVDHTASPLQLVVVKRS